MFQADVDTRSQLEIQTSKFFQIKTKIIKDAESGKPQTLIQIIDVSHKIYYLDIRS